MIRTHLVKALYENLLGPKMESTESIEEPFLKYELGILNSSFSPDVVAPGNNDVIDDTPDQFEEGDTETTTNAEGTQVLDHLRREIDTDLSLLDGVSSVGISFVLEPKNENENKIPQFKVCLTWGRYTRNVEFGDLPKMFDRHPNYFVTEWINPTLNFESLKLTQEAKGEERQITMNGASLHVLIIPIENSQKYVVRIFLVNETPYDTAGRQTETERIFQPQIRVIVNDDANVGDLDDVVPIHNVDQDNDDALLYRNLKTKSKGYLCAAVWKDVDPEFSNNDIKNITWKDSQTVPQKIKDNFTCPDVRTEYLPLYAILQPDSPQSQEFNAKILSETWNQSDLELNLRSIEKDYGNWIESQKTKLDEEKNSHKIDSSLEKIGLDNIEECNKSKDKISEGVTFLINDKTARAAFCFMNSVMNDKRIADVNKDLNWKEFQMAFILQSLVGVTEENPDQRDIADVLWFPTGGGKTEAYLGIVIFALAYRRLSFNSTNSNLSNDGGVGVISRYTLRLLTVQQFQRALGAIVIADVKRVTNWLPEHAKTGSEKITDPVLLKKLDDGTFWGNQRFSIGMWIGKDTTPNDFAIQPIWTGRQQKIVPHCEGILLPTTDRIHNKIDDGKSGKPDQIQNCPICKNILCIPNVSSQLTREFTKLTWIVRLSKNKETVDKFTKDVFENYDVVLNTKPIFELISNPSATEFYYRLTMEIRTKMKHVSLDRDLIDKWWRDAVETQLVNSDQEPSLQSTSPSMPGYFFLKSGDKNYDFTLFCTNSECTLNQFEWFEKLENKYDAQVPPAFKIKNSKNISTSIPISAYVSDAQVYSKCPSFLITTVDKFARLPFEPKCASIFGNVDVIHPLFGYGRKSTITSPIRKDNRAGWVEIPDAELDDVSGFNPPSLILQDELHLIEGPLGSMTGIYEMAIDILCNNGLKPKYIASSATIKEAKSQVGTIFRKDVSIFPKPGIDSFDNYFSKIEEDQSCVKERYGRLYLGMLSYKTAVFLPIKSQSIIMSEIFKMKEFPELYDLTSEERSDIDKATDPYWTFVSYFTDLALLSKFTNWYKENVMELVPSLSTVKINNSLQRANSQTLESGLRLFSIVADKKMIIDSVSIFCTNDVGNIRVALYVDGNPIGKKIGNFGSKRCTTGENKFKIKNLNYEIKNNEKIWVAVINDSSETQFESVNSPLDSFVTDPLTSPTDFPDTLTNVVPFAGDSIKINLNSSPRELNDEKNIPLSSETDSQELVKHLDELDKPGNIDSLQTSPVFGTGIDVGRLGIIQIMTQPKTNSGYIQSSGRVGRNNFGLVLTWLRAGRVRDLNHYENFVGYHRMIHKFVEPVTASPFSNEAIELCLGPIIIAILRNARKVNGVAIHNNWINQEGAKRMKDHDGDDDVKSIKDALTDVCSSNHIAVFRQMHPVKFKTLLEESISRWHNTAYHLFQDAKPFVYSETVYGAGSSPEQNVVLGTLTHKLQQLVTVYDNPPNSLRNTESTAQFYGADGTSEIRPSQFITRYGPGTLISADGKSLVIPSAQNILGDLNRQPNFDVPDLQGNRGLLKYEIEDNKMKRLLHRSNRNIAFRNLKLFRLPTNDDLELSAKDNLYHCDSFPKWVQCTSKLHKNVRILAQLEYSNRGEEIIKCPECQRVRHSKTSPPSDWKPEITNLQERETQWRLSPTGNAESTKFIASKLVVACKEGHLGDVNWEKEVHSRIPGNCRGNVFTISTGSGDNTRWECYGHWNQNNFVRSTCDASVDNLELKNRSVSGRIECTKNIVETGREDQHGCPPIDPATNLSKAKLTSKYQMSIRLPIISTSMELDPAPSDLFKKLLKAKNAITPYLLGHKDKENISKDEFVNWLESMVPHIHDINDNQILAVKLAKQEHLTDVLKEIIDSTSQPGAGVDALSEKQSLESELNTLENTTINSGSGVSIPSGSTHNRIPIKFSTSFNLHFESMPFDKIKVTQVQSAYTREISPPTPIGAPPIEIDFDRREGDVVSHTEKIILVPDGVNEQTWYIANQLRGEGIFLHLDPDEHSTAMEIFRNAVNDDDFTTWTRIHDETRNYAEPELAQLRQNPIDNSQAIDELENKIFKTHPLFVWWHSFAHEFINQLAVDSGFSGVALGERVYWLKKGNDRFAAGIFIYASSPGTDGTLGGLTSLVDQRILPVIVEKALHKMKSCSNDPICSSSKINESKRNGAACHVCLMNSETSCAYFNKFLDRNLVRGTL